LTWQNALAFLFVSLLFPCNPGWSADFDFNRDIRPILSNHCFHCHGPDEQTREAGLRLDLASGAFSNADSGSPAIVPGDTEASTLMERILTDDHSLLMPPPETNKPLSAAQKEILAKWILAGAPWSDHWSFAPVVRPAEPQGEFLSANPIDRFVRSKLRDRGWSSAPEADRITLARRLFLDLTGLPPSPQQVTEFVNDPRPDAYEQLVESLLASPHFGEKMAIQWLDAARFADTNGYHLDNGRDMSVWRAWVIDAFNTNMPFDQFTIEQLAGDLLENPTPSQLIATGFNRNHMINFEGGAIPEEYHNAYIVDRVNTTGALWLGMSVGCGQCHDHKYDPLTQREYYQLYAFFNNIDEKGLDGNKGNAAPLLPVPTPEQQQRLAELDSELNQLQESLQTAQQSSSTDDEIQRLQKAIEEKTKARQEYLASTRTTMVMRERGERRETFVLERGEYDRKKEKVEPALPAFLPGWQTTSAKSGDNQTTPSGLNRLDLARWLVSDQHPLTPRVAVNRLWQTFFGTGIVKTMEEFGSQGELPSHPELLDWLAAEFRDPQFALNHGGKPHRWDVNHIIRLIVHSETYRQSSQVPTEHYSRDPENRWLARASRFRLPAELIRDQALVASGLIRHNVGGPSVSPYQPDGLWQELSSRNDSKNWTAQEFVQSHGDDLYRRGMYTFWKRTSPPPMMSTFDAPDRETCTLQRSRTNTPLQALVLMNDPVFVEAARKMGERVLREAPAETNPRIHLAMELATGRRARDRELEILRRMLAQFEKQFTNPESATRFLEVGESTVQWENKQELAAWALLCSAILNLDEVVTRN
jgi:hypothetical protein